jgi:hypothetical protein
MVTDFAVMEKDWSIHLQGPNSGAREIRLDEWQKIAASAQKNGQKVMMITNLYDAKGGERNLVPWESVTDEQMDKLFAGWTAVMETQSKKAQAIHADYLMVNPRDINFNFGPLEAKAATRWARVFATVRANYQGKVCFGSWSSYFLFTSQWGASGADCLLVDDTPEQFMKTVPQELPAITAAWKEHFKAFREVNAQYPKAELFLNLLMPSYDGAMQKGWMEPVSRETTGTRDDPEQALVYEGFFQALYDEPLPGVVGVQSYGYWWHDAFYPDVWVRNDLSHSIRQKDAESVFAKWARVFS